MSTTTASSSVLQTISVAVVGVGLVGAEFVRQLLSLPQPHPFRIVSLSSSKTHLFGAEGLDIDADTWKEKLGSASGKADIPDLVRELAALVTPGRRVVLVDNTSSDAVAGFYPEFLRVGVNVVTPNKKAFSSNLDLYERILSTSLESGARFYNESTVGAGLPIINTLKDLVATGDQVSKIEGVFSGTLSYIFNEFSTGKAEGPSFSSIVKIAREKGYTEPHPGDDLNGADVARKLTILSRYIPSLRSALPAGYASVRTESLVPSELEAIKTGDAFMESLPGYDEQFDRLRAEAAEDGQVLRFVGVVDATKGEIKAELARYPTTHPFATSLGGSDNIVMFHTERYGARPLIVQGAGAGAAVTAMGVLGDVLKLL